MSTRKPFQKFTSKQIDELYEYHCQLPKLSNRQLAEWATQKFDLPDKPHRSSIGRALKRKQEACENDGDPLRMSKKQQAGRFPDVEQAVYMWITERQSKNVPLSWDLITTASLDFAERFGHGDKQFKASNGWQDRFRRRYDLGELNIHGESGTLGSSHVEKNIPDPVDENPSLTANDEIVKLIQLRGVSTTRERVPETQEHVPEDQSVDVIAGTDDHEETPIPMPLQDKVYYLTQVINILDIEHSETRRQLIKLRSTFRAQLNSRQA